VRMALPDVSFPESPDEDCRAAYGYAVVVPTDRPNGDVVTEGKPKLVDGVWVKTWDVREYTPAELDVRLTDIKRRRSEQVLAVRESDLADGFIYTTEDDRVFGVQLRPEDRPNLLLLLMKAERFIAAGVDTLTKFRSTENESYLLTPVELKRMCDAALATGEAVFDASWALKDQIAAATTIAELPEVPTTLM
jgi:hypothetical protein